MKYILLVLLILSPLLLTATAQTTMTALEAMAKAETIWGANAQLGQVSNGFTATGAVRWTRQVGYLDLDGKFAIVGQGGNWTLAFANMPPDYVPPSIAMWTAVATDAAGNSHESEPAVVLVCNAPCVTGTVDRVTP